MRGLFVLLFLLFTGAVFSMNVGCVLPGKVAEHGSTHEFGERTMKCVNGMLRDMIPEACDLVKILPPPPPGPGGSSPAAELDTIF